MVGRFTLNCCVADASAIGMVIEWAEARQLNLDTWVQVEGKLHAREFDGELTPVLVADSVSEVSPPSQPYFYP